jgi:hypothetical protein
MRRPRPLPRTTNIDIEKLKRQREQLVKARKSTALLDRRLCIEVARQIRQELKAS